MKKEWNLLFTDEDINLENFFSKEAETKLVELIKDFPHKKINLLSLYNDVYKGNKIATYIISLLEDLNKLRYSCLRIDCFSPDLNTFFSITKADVIFLDNLQFDIFNKENFNNLFNILGSALMKSNLIIFNIPNQNLINQIPEAISSYIKNGLNINIIGD